MLKRGLAGLALVAALAACGGDDGHAQAMDACMGMQIVAAGGNDVTATMRNAGKSATAAVQADDKYTNLALLVNGFPTELKDGDERTIALTVDAIAGECQILGYPWDE